MAEGEKKCPRCAEMVKQEAAACRFCGYDFFHSAANPFVSPPKNSFQSCMGCIGTGLVVLFVLYLIGSILP